jgi:galacturan 1,4-alpha-galacturonidase
MRFSFTAILLAATATLSLASPFQARDHGNDDSGSGGKDNGKGKGDDNPHISPRPPITCHPKHPGVPPPSPPPRGKVCYVDSHNDGVSDDTKFILQALHDCNNGGHVVFKEGTNYFIATAMDLTFLKHIDLGTNMTC